MVPADFRLDTIAAHLIERLEGARPTFADDPAKAEATFQEIAHDVVRAASREASEYVDDPNHPDRLVHEVMHTFLPRYTRLAVDQNHLEKTHFGAWRGGDPLVRIGLTLVAVAVAAVVSRELPLPLEVVVWSSAALVPLSPAIRRSWFRYRFQKDLQAILDDMGRIQDQLGVYGVAPGETALPTREPAYRQAPETTAAPADDRRAAEAGRSTRIASKE